MVNLFSKSKSTDSSANEPETAMTAGFSVSTLPAKYSDPNLDQFRLKATLGTGTFGRVRLVQDRTSKRYHALKILKKSAVVRLKQVDHVKNEKNILASIHHPFLVNMLGSFQDPLRLYLIMEYVPGGELFSLLRRENKFSNDVAVFYGAQVILAFEYLHSKHIIYRDLKPENLLIGADGYLKVTDFGFAKVVEDRTWTLCGTPEYLAPEIIQSCGHGKPVDWWAIGILLYEMLAGFPPFFDESPFGIYQKILKGNLEFPRGFSKEAKDLIRKLLTADRSKRYGCLKNGAEDIKRHPWFKALDWDALLHKRLRPPYVPKLKSESDTSNFDDYPDSDEDPEPVPNERELFGDF